MKIRQRTPIALPKVEPIVPVARPQPFNDPARLFEPKYDGFRGVVYLTGRRCTIHSKRGNAFFWPSLVTARLEELRRRRAWVHST